MVWGTPDRHSASLWANRLSETGVGVLVLFSGLGLDIKSTTQVCQDSGVVEREGGGGGEKKEKKRNCVVCQCEAHVMPVCLLL